jgi:hypothetical protein
MKLQSNLDGIRFTSSKYNRHIRFFEHLLRSDQTFNLQIILGDRFDTHFTPNLLLAEFPRLHLHSNFCPPHRPKLLIIRPVLRKYSVGFPETSPNNLTKLPVEIASDSASTYLAGKRNSDFVKIPLTNKPTFTCGLPIVLTAYLPQPATPQHVFRCS